jgi:hypothetical protein
LVLFLKSIPNCPNIRSLGGVRKIDSFDGIGLFVTN